MPKKAIHIRLNNSLCYDIYNDRPDHVDLVDRYHSHEVNTVSRHITTWYQLVDIICESFEGHKEYEKHDMIMFWDNMDVQIKQTIQKTCFATHVDKKVVYNVFYERAKNKKGSDGAMPIEDQFRRYLADAVEWLIS